MKVIKNKYFPPLLKNRSYLPNNSVLKCFNDKLIVIIRTGQKFSTKNVFHFPTSSDNSKNSKNESQLHYLN